MKETGGRVLLADDEESFALTTSRLIERHGLDCDVAYSATQAVSLLEQTEYDVLVADIKMPGNDRLALCEQLSNRDHAPAVILVTGYPSVDTAVRSMDLGVFAYKVKPFELEDFIDTVRDGIRHTTLRRKLGDHAGIIQVLDRRIAVMRERLEHGRALALDETACEYLQLMLTRMAETSMEAADLICLLDRGDAERPVRELARHPDVEVLRNAVSESVAVLEKTKNSFKSRELAHLRKRLSQLLDITS